ncbi:4191_t:CDS:2 [Diversispora eburnea]|uniref:4191_t:CDS:1 n=1 Tax=Diversispora eburnea TaxID=1213867 RepID=A0A9N9AFH2_9GLOM|nr:4191_t:CDS:2 [Diversispora eburnea]
MSTKESTARLFKINQYAKRQRLGTKRKYTINSDYSGFHYNGQLSRGADGGH